MTIALILNFLIIVIVNFSSGLERLAKNLWKHRRIRKRDSSIRLIKESELQSSGAEKHRDTMITRSVEGKYLSSKLKINSYNLNKDTRKKLLDKKWCSQTHSKIKECYMPQEECSSDSTSTFRLNKIHLNKFCSSFIKL